MKLILLLLLVGVSEGGKLRTVADFPTYIFGLQLEVLRQVGSFSTDCTHAAAQLQVALAQAGPNWQTSPVGRLYLSVLVPKISQLEQIGDNVGELRKALVSARKDMSVFKKISAESQILTNAGSHAIAQSAEAFPNQPEGVLIGAIAQFRGVRQRYRQRFERSPRHHLPPAVF